MRLRAFVSVRSVAAPSVEAAVFGPGSDFGWCEGGAQLVSAQTVESLERCLPVAGQHF